MRRVIVLLDAGHSGPMQKSTTTAPVAKFFGDNRVVERVDGAHDSAEARAEAVDRGAAGLEVVDQLALAEQLHVGVRAQLADRAPVGVDHEPALESSGIGMRCGVWPAGGGMRLITSMAHRVTHRAAA